MSRSLILKRNLRGASCLTHELEIDGKGFLSRANQVGRFEGGDIRIIDYKTGSEVDIEQMGVDIRLVLHGVHAGAKLRKGSPQVCSTIIS